MIELIMNPKIYERYHKNRKVSDRVIPEHSFTYINLINALKPYIDNKKKNILDIGCGVGTLSIYMASKGHSVTGIDISKKAISIANLSKNRLGNNYDLNFKVSSAEKFSRIKKYDLVLISEVLEHLESDIQIIKKLYAIMDDVSSKLIVTVPSANAPLYRLGLLKQFDIDVGHLRRYKSKDLVNLLELGGFKVIKIIKSEGIMRNLLFTNKIFGFIVRFMNIKLIGRLFMVIDRLTIPLFGESQLIVVCKK